MAFSHHHLGKFAGWTDHVFIQFWKANFLELFFVCVCITLATMICSHSSILQDLFLMHRCNVKGLLYPTKTKFYETTNGMMCMALEGAQKMLPGVEGCYPF